MKTGRKCNYRIINLAYSCPLYMKNPHCPLKDVRTRQFNEKVTWFNSLSPSTKQTLHDYHVQCYLKHTGKNKETCQGGPDRKEEEVSTEGEPLPTDSDKDCSLLHGSPEKFCKVTEYLFGALLCGESQAQGQCRHQYTIGGNTFCSSPARKEIYKKYKL